jgi:hypothetical protein
MTVKRLASRPQAAGTKRTYNSAFEKALDVIELPAHQPEGDRENAAANGKVAFSKKN